MAPRPSRLDIGLAAGSAVLTLLVLFGEGISKSGDLIDLAVADNILEKSGAWFSYGGERVGQGRENARNYLQERPKMLAEIEAKVLAKHGLSRGKSDAAASGARSDSDAKANGEAKPGASAKPDVKDAKPEARDAKSDVKDAKPDSKEARPDAKHADAKHNDVKANDKSQQRPRA